MKKFSARLGREEGFTLVEALVAVSLLTIAIVLTITPVLSGFGVLSEAKLATIASNLAQARVEELRSLDYEDIGFPLGLPEGILAATETVTVQNIDF
ncbi:MAG: type IV pilus modification PilV family protein, partial [Acidimicrobiia bacterium]